MSISSALANAQLAQELGAATSRTRRAVAQRAPQAFAMLYLPHHFSKPASPMHKEVFDLLGSASTTRGQRIAIAAPRGHAKSTVVTLAYTLWCALYRGDSYIMIVSATSAQALQHLRNIRDELDTNPRIHMDFPEFAPERGRPAPWRGNTLQLPNGVKLWAVGSGQQIRGTRHRQYRPSLIIADDLEVLEHTASQEQREKIEQWFNRTLLKSGDERTNVIVVGTILHYDALLAKLVQSSRSPGWVSRKYKALITPPDKLDMWAKWERIYTELDEYAGGVGTHAAARYLQDNHDAMHVGSRVLWPEHDSLAALMDMRIREGEPSFSGEKQNEPLDPQRCVFAGEFIRYWDDEYADEVQLLKSLRDKRTYIYGAWDPSVGRDKRRGDYSAVVILLQNEDEGIMYVLAADLLREPPSHMIERIVEYARIYEFYQFGIEENGFQKELEELLVEAAQKAKVRLRVDGIKNTTDKRGRITMLEPLFRQGRIRLCRRHTQLNEQIRQFPLATHDDGPDALELAVQVARIPGPLFFIPGMRSED